VDLLQDLREETKVKFFIIDDDPAVRSMLAHIVEDEDLGQVVGEAEDGSEVDAYTLTMKHVDIVIVDLLMPNRDGIETVRELLPSYSGKIIMLSQVDSKEIIGKVYSLGIEYYVIKPINRLEIIAVIRKVTERMKLQRSIQDFKKSIDFLSEDQSIGRNEKPLGSATIHTSGNYLLSELGMVGESGSQDLLDMLEYLHRLDIEQPLQQGFPPLREIFMQIALKKNGQNAEPHLIQREIKACEQRIRRAIFHALNHLASLGLTDFSNPKFENYASKFFDFVEVRKRMIEIAEDSGSNVHNKINTKKFIQVLYLEAKQLMGVLH
jgi:two-component system response regulator YcbB